MNEPALHHRWHKIVALSAIGFGLLLAYGNRFIQDDAFISFRYALNFANGDGLTWNPGDTERVEGYTNFLWTLLMAIPFRVGIDVVSFSYAMSLLCMLGTLISTHRLAKLLLGTEYLATLAVLLLGTNYTFSAYGTGGLETQLQTFLCTLSLLLTFKSSRSQAWNTSRLITISLLCAMAGMTRLDSAIPFLAIYIFLIWNLIKSAAVEKKSVVLIALLLPVGSIMAWWLLWKYHYYGDILPNTFYVKAGTHSLEILKEGVSFIYQFFNSYWLVPFAFFGLFAWKKLVAHQEMRVFFFVLALWFLYTVKIGGGFMEFRFFVPVMPMLFILILWLTKQLNNKSLETALIVMVFAGSLHHVKTFKETQVTSVNTLMAQLFLPPENWCAVGKKLGELFSEKKEEVLIAVAPAGAIPFYSGLPAVDMLGLNDRWVAKNGVPVGLRPGHRKGATHRYLVERGVNLVIGQPWVKPINTPVPSPYPIEKLGSVFRLERMEPELFPKDAVVIEVPVGSDRRIHILYIKRNEYIDKVIERNNIKTYKLSVGTTITPDNA